MQFTKPAKFLILISVSALFFQSCRTVSTGENVNSQSSETAMTEPPFANKEPEKYQTEIWQNSDRGIEKYFAARDGAKWRIDSAYGDANQVTSMHTDKDYVISFASKIYAEYPPSHGFDEREGMIGEISRGMINAREKAVFEKVGTEGGITKYRIADAAKNLETIVYFDEKIGLPVKKEVFKTDGGQRVFDHSVELSGFKTEVDPTLFMLPSGFRKASTEEMKKVLSGIK